METKKRWRVHWKRESGKPESCETAAETAELAIERIAHRLTSYPAHDFTAEYLGEW